MSTIESRVKEAIARMMGISAADLKSETSFADDLGADSLDEVEIVMELEDEFDIEIPDSDAEKCKTVQQVVDYIAGRVPA